MQSLATLRFSVVARDVAVEPLRQLVEDHPEWWTKDTWRQDAPGSAHRETRAIHVRAPVSADVAGVFYGLVTVPNDPAYDTVLGPILNDLIEDLRAKVQGRNIGRVMLVELPAGGRIATHTDEGAYAQHFDRFHLALQSDVGNHFESMNADGSVEDGIYVEPGSWVWFDHTKPHRCFNVSDRPRWHLVVDMVAPPYRALRCEGVSFQPETLATFWDEALPLFERHYSEVAFHHDIPLVPDTPNYHAIEQRGALRIYTVRTLPDFQLIGYEMVFVRHDMHYATSLQAHQDVLFVAPEYRKGRLGSQLIAYADSFLAAEGVVLKYEHCKAKPGQDLGPLLKRMGYELINFQYGKRLDRKP